MCKLLSVLTRLSKFSDNSKVKENATGALWLLKDDGLNAQQTDDNQRSSQLSGGLSKHSTVYSLRHHVIPRLNHT